ncbi:MAG: choice-of-anchor Q domain-containing protein, partial [Candidatus Stygibacter australis]|nr:choice-of-anchor Q domain-containing protein [Candidatus Stygibacter australis]
GEYPFRIDEGSPAIDMGTLMLPEGVVLPEYDRSGNLRIRGNGIDLGAYEYNPYSNPVNEDELEYSNLIIYPNPVHLKQGRGSVVINYPTSDDEADYELSIYNIKGQRINSFKIQNSKLKICEARWDCCDSDGEKVATGVYFLRISRDEEFIDQGKLTVVK